MNHLAISIDNPAGGGKIVIQTPRDVPSGGLDTVGAATLQTGITLFFVGVAILALIFFIWGGITWITSGGDKTKIQNARNKMVYSVIGLIIAFLAFFIVSLIGTLFGVDLLKAP